jgi:predicted methyltransferase
MIKLYRRQVTLCSLSLVLGSVLVACASAPPATVTPERAAQIVASPDRTAADRTNDQRRKPEHLLVFMAIKPGMVVLDVSAGGGYTTELLARAIGPLGTVYGQSQARDPARPPPAAPEGGGAPPAASAGAPNPALRTSAMALAEREQRLRTAGVSAAPIVAVVQRFDDPVPAPLAIGGLDMVTLMFNYHDLGHLAVDRAAMNRALFRALKPGSVYIIADHAGRAGTGISESGTLHRIEEAFLRAEVESAGFRLQAERPVSAQPG